MNVFTARVILVGVLFLCASAALAEVPLPDDVKLTPPPSGLREDVAAFSGRWSGVWLGDLEAMLIVEEIDADKAKVIYAWGDAPRLNIAKGFQRYAATVESGGNAEIRFGSGSVSFNVVMASDLSKVKVTRMIPMRAIHIEWFKRAPL